MNIRDGLPRRLRTVLEQRYGAAAQVLRSLLPVPVDAVVVSGSGMSSLLHDVAEPILSYDRLPGFPQPTVAGHTGIVRHAVVEGISVLFFAGRSHMYEGVSPEDIVAPVAVGSLLGTRTVLLLNSAGGLHPGCRTGDIMVIADTINMTFRSVRRGWFYGTPLSYRHPPTFFDEDLRRSAGIELVRQGIAYREGTYIGVAGPSYETPAEVRFFRRLGAHVIGMSTVHEAEFAHVCGMKVAGCSLISNTLQEVAAPQLVHEEVLAAARAGCAAIEAWIRSCCLALRRGHGPSAITPGQTGDSVL